MREFTTDIVDILNKRFSNDEEFIQSITLAHWGFNIQFYNFDIQCDESVLASIDSQLYKWDEAPNASPWGSLVRQVPKNAELKSPLQLKISFESGDYLIIETSRGMYESVKFTFPPENSTHVMTIF